jgi:hypothetical protein
VEGDERTPLVLPGELGAGVELEVIGSPVGWKIDERALHSRTASYRGPVPSILRRQDLGVGGRVIIAVRPTEVVARFDPNKFLGRFLGALLYREKLAPESRELISAVYDAVEGTGRMDPEGHGVP